MARERDDHTRYGFPPQGDPFRKLPATVPWDDPISGMPEFWLDVSCSCGSSSRIPLRLLAAEQGWSLTLREILPRLRCHACRSAAASVELLDDGAYEPGRHGHAMALL